MMQSIKEQNTVQAVTLELPGGTYSPRESKELLLKMLNDQENFYKVKNLGLDLRFGYQDDHIWQKVHELQSAKKTVEEVLTEARDMGLNIRINSNIEISLCTDPSDTSFNLPGI